MALQMQVPEEAVLIDPQLADPRVIAIPDRGGLVIMLPGEPVSWAYRGGHLVRLEWRGPDGDNGEWVEV